ncbi:DUF3196 family protein [Mycoplasmoides genitalium]
MINKPNQFLNHLDGLKQHFSDYDSLQKSFKKYLSENQTELNNFFFNQFEKIIVLVKKKEFKTAQERCEEELATPYFSKPLVGFFQSLLQLINHDLIEQKNQQLANMSCEKIVEMVLSDYPNKLNLIHYLLAKEASFVNPNLLQRMTFVLTDLELLELKRFSFFKALNQIPAFKNHKVTYFNSKLKQKFVITLGEFAFPQTDKTKQFFQQLIKKVSQLFLKEPVSCEFAYEIIDALLVSFFPLHPNLKVNHLAKKIHQYVSKIVINEVVDLKDPTTKLIVDTLYEQLDRAIGEEN